MNPIYERKPSGGIGYGFNDFLEHFFEICYEHLRNRRAQAFAFILFDFEHGDVFKTITDQSVFTKLDRISGEDLTIFYLNSKDRYLIDDFNRIFGQVLGSDDVPRPAIFFFKIIGNEAEGIEFYPISNNKLFAFHEIYEKVDDYILRLNERSTKHHDFFKVVLKKLNEAGFDYLAGKFFDALTRS